MKKLLFLLGAFSIYFNSEAQIIPDAPEDKAVIYFMRTESKALAVSYTYFDGEKYIGSFRGSGFFRYECAPGSHLFWAHATNFSYVDALVEAGKTYFIDSDPGLGTVKIFPLKKNKRSLRTIKSMLKGTGKEFAEGELGEKSLELADLIASGNLKYNDDVKKGKKVVEMGAEHAIANEDFKLLEKKKKK